MSEVDDSDHTLGHRSRLRRRFLVAGAEALADYELLELLLFGALPRGDVKPLAKRLIARFGSFAAAVNAPVDALARVDGMGQASVVALKTAQAAAIRLLGEPLRDQPLLSSWSQLLDYCRVAMAGLQAASAYVKGELGRRLKMRRTPEVVFVLDRGLEKGNTVLGLLQRLETERREREEPLAEAGEVDPAADPGSDS